jgi:hypothetical protein
MQGRQITGTDLKLIRDLMQSNPDWHRTRLSQELCELWDWRNALGRPKDMAARTLLLKLERSGHIKLPPAHRTIRQSKRKRQIPPPVRPEQAICSNLCDLRPLCVDMIAPRSADIGLFNSLLAHEHYLGYRNTVGENMRYLVRDRHDRVIAALLFGSAAWKCADRDAFIGWDQPTRERNLQYLTNNTRFLIPDWVQVPHLASHVLGLVARRIRNDWLTKYGHPLYALETFVDRSRFKGTCYRAANWLRLGKTQGRSRNDRKRDITVPIKDIWLYPLIKEFNKGLCRDHS